MNKIISILLLLLTVSLEGQEIESFMQQVAENNPEILAYGRLLEARKIDARTGLTPPDPEISFGYMPEKTNRSDIKRTWTATQSFSFPTKYITQNKLSKQRIVLAEHEFNLVKLNILLSAKLLLYDLNYNRRKVDLLNMRKDLYERMRSGYKKMLDAGQTSVLDYNKILFEMSDLSLNINRTETEIAIINEKLKYMSGGEVAIPVKPQYLPVPDHDLEYIINAKSITHPSFLLPDSEYIISQNEAKLSRAGILPEFQAGYAAEIIPGENFQGPVAGMTIPLWSNTNKIKAASAMAEHFAALREAQLLELKSEIQSEYENMEVLRKNISELRELLSTGNNRQYLEKVLNSGEISLTEYFLYLGSIFQIEDRLLEMENEFNKSLAVLYDHELLKQH